MISFDDITSGDGVPIHRPIMCCLHGSEDQLMKYFCNSCQQPICNECMLHDHRQPGHEYEKIADIERREVCHPVLLGRKHERDVIILLMSFVIPHPLPKKAAE